MAKSGFQMIRDAQGNLVVKVTGKKQKEPTERKKTPKKAGEKSARKPRDTDKEEDFGNSPERTYE